MTRHTYFLKKKKKKQTQIVLLEILNNTFSENLWKLAKD